MTKTEKLHRMDADRLLTKQAVFFYPIFQKTPQELKVVAESKILPRGQISLFAHLSLGPLVGEGLPQTLHYFADAKAISLKGGFNLSRKYNTPKRSHIVKTRLDDEELADFLHRMELYGMNQSEFIRQAISGATIRPIITVSPVNDELLSAIGKLTSEYGRIGNNLNQIARHLNEWRSPYPAMAKEMQAAAADLATLIFEVLKKIGDALGNIQTHQL